MPGLSKAILVQVDEFLNSVQFRPRIAAAFLQPDWIKPKFRDIVVAFDMDMRWFIAITCIKEEAIGAHPQYSRHLSSFGCRLNDSMLSMQDEA